MRSGARIPNPTTPTSRSSPQKLTHTRLIGPSDQMKAASTSSSTTSALASKDDSHPSERSVAPRAGERKMSAAAPVDTPDATNNAPSQGLSAQMGRFLTDKRIRSEERRVGKECRSRWSPDE